MIPRLAFPFTIRGSSAVTVEQDTLDEVTQSVQIILTTLRGSRIELPEFGVADMTFSSPLQLDDAVRAVRRWEPRAIVAFTDQPDTLDVLVQHVIANVKLRTRGS